MRLFGNFIAFIAFASIIDGTAINTKDDSVPSTNDAVVVETETAVEVEQQPEKVLKKRHSIFGRDSSISFKDSIRRLGLRSSSSKSMAEEPVEEEKSEPLESVKDNDNKEEEDDDENEGESLRKIKEKRVTKFFSQYLSLSSSTKSSASSKTSVDEGEEKKATIDYLALKSSESGKEFSCPPKDFQVQSDLDLDSYLSQPWYAQEQMAVKYQPESDFFCVKAQYVRTGVKDVAVYNYGRRGGIRGEVQFAHLKAVVADIREPAKILVGPSFLPTFLMGPYWIVAAGVFPSTSTLSGRKYDWAIVSGGAPKLEGKDGKCRVGDGSDGNGLWILTRESIINDQDLDFVRNIASEKGFDLSVLKRVVHEGCDYSFGNNEADKKKKSSKSKGKKEEEKKIEDKVEEKIEEKVIDEKLEEKIEDKVVDEKLEEKIDETIDEIVAEKIEDKNEEKLEDKVVDEKVEEKIEEKLEEKIQEKIEEKIDETIDEIVAEKTEDKNEEKDEEKDEEKVDEEIEEKEVDEKVNENVDEKIEEKEVDENVDEKIDEKVKENIEEKIEEIVAEKIEDKNEEKIQEERKKPSIDEPPKAEESKADEIAQDKETKSDENVPQGPRS